MMDKYCTPAASLDGQ